MRRLSLAGMCVLAWCIPSQISAQPYPSRPIAVVVPYAAGGPADALARLLGERMNSRLGQPVIVENVGGAAGTLGVARVVRAAPDGYTFGIGHWSTHVLNGAFYKLPYNLLTDLEPIARLPTNPAVINVRKDFPAKDLKELVAWLKANPDKASAATGGNGSSAHVTSAYFQKITGTSFGFVPYRGAGPAITDLIAGTVDLMFDQASNSIAQIRGGTIRALAVTSRTRLGVLPDVPTVDEAGVPGLYNSTWYGFWAPKGTPKDIIAKLNAAANEAMANPDVKKRLLGLGLELPPADQHAPEALGAWQKAEIEKWWPLIEAAGIKVQ